MALYSIAPYSFNRNKFPQVKFGKMSTQEMGALKERIKPLSIGREFYGLLFALANPGALQYWSPSGYMDIDILNGLIAMESYAPDGQNPNPVDKTKALLSMVELSVKNIGQKDKLLKFCEMFNLSEADLSAYNKFTDKVGFHVPHFESINLNNGVMQEKSYALTLLLIYSVAEHQGKEGLLKFFDHLPTNNQNQKASLMAQLGVRK